MIIKTGDSNALYSMVGVLISFMPVVLGYFVKSTKENSKDGIVYEKAMAQMQPPNLNDTTNEEAVG